MSSVRMCDKCERVFSEREEGWQTFTGTTMKKKNGVRTPITETLDMCANCAIGADDLTDEEKAALRQNERISALEKSVGMEGDTFIKKETSDA